MIKHKSTLAKLMARENITVQYGNYQTAWFDIKNRVLGLPMWKDMGKDVSDLLIGHEVGHALFTPFEGWHDSPEKLEGCPRSYINVVEDARIERHIKEIVKNNEPRVRLLEVKATGDNDQNLVNVYIQFSIVASERDEDLNITLYRVR